MTTIITIEECSKICNIIFKTIRNCFGPRGQLAFVINSTGQAEFTTSGMTVIENLHHHNPIVKIAQNSLQKYYSIVGDGSKTFIILLNEIFYQIIQCKSLISGNDSRIKLICGFSLFLQNILPLCFKTLRYKITSSIVRNIETSMINHYLFKTFFNGKYGILISEQLSNLIHELLIRYCNNMYTLVGLQYIIDYFNVICINVGCMAIQDSKIIPGVIFTRDFTNKCNINIKDSKAKFIVWLNDGEDFVDASLCIKDNQNVYKFLEVDFSTYLKGIKQKKQECVKLIICTGKLSDLVQNLCIQYDINTLTMVPIEEVNYLLSLVEIQPVYNIFESTTEKNCGNLEFIKNYQIGSKSCVHLGLKCKQNIIPHHLLICGPTDRICKAYSRQCLNSLKLFHLWKKDEDEYMNYSYINETNCTENSSLLRVDSNIQLYDDNQKSTSSSKDINNSYLTKLFSDLNLKPETTKENSTNTLSTIYPGGGCWEICIYQLLVNLKSSDLSKELVIICEILSKSLLSIPSLLYSNNCTNNSPFSLVFTQIENDLASNDFYYINKWGEIKSIKEADIFEPVIEKELLIYHVIQLVIQLLHLQSIESAHTILTIN